MVSKLVGNLYKKDGTGDATGQCVCVEIGSQDENLHDRKSEMFKKISADFGAILWPHTDGQVRVEKIRKAREMQQVFVLGDWR